VAIAPDPLKEPPLELDELGPEELLLPVALELDGELLLTVCPKLLVDDWGPPATRVEEVPDPILLLPPEPELEGEEEVELAGVVEDDKAAPTLKGPISERTLFASPTAVACKE